MHFMRYAFFTKLMYLYSLSHSERFLFMFPEHVWIGPIKSQSVLIKLRIFLDFTLNCHQTR